MKELSTEQKAKAYDEATKVIKDNLNALNEITETGAEVVNIQSIKNCFYRAFPELKESEDERIRKCIGDVVREHDWSHIFGVTKDDCLAWIEKQAEQKPNDRVEPKFHEGEWITNGDYTWKIVEVKPLDYILQSQDGNIVDDTISHVDEQFHSFTIEDAKDGDVLACNNVIYLTHGNTKSLEQFHAYFGVSLNGTPSTFINEWCCLAYKDEVLPATQEQRDLLFQKMKEVEYEWDADKKEAKKIEQKPTDEDMKEALRTEYEKGRADAIAEMQVAWSEEDEETLGWLCIFLNDYGHEFYEGDEENVIDWLKSLKDRALPQPKQEWSEEDIRNIEDIDSILFYNKDLPEDTCMRLRNWLKSLRPQNTWKPSDEQMIILQEAIGIVGQLTPRGECLKELVEQLKKLKEY